jgi:hypothetical protein
LFYWVEAAKVTCMLAAAQLKLPAALGVATGIFPGQQHIT